MTKRAQVQPLVERGACALYVSPGVMVSDKDIEAGFRWLETWDVLMPLMSYTLLAKDYAHPATTACGKDNDIVLDLRQPVYDERIMFVRHSEGLAPNSVGSSADALLAARAKRGDCLVDSICPMPMLKAIWEVKPLLLALPESWIGEVV